MSISIFNNPGTYSPANAEMWVGLSASESTLPNFKYILKINKKDLNTSAITVLGSYKFPPRPDTYNGLFTPNKILRSELSYKPYPFVTRPTKAIEGLVKYFYDYGYEYDPNFFVYDMLNWSSKLQLKMSGMDALSFAVGDIIQLSLTNQISNPDYNGTMSITTIGISGTYSFITTDKAYGTGVTYSQTGQIDLLRKMVGTSSNYYSYNGTQQYDEIGTDWNSKIPAYGNNLVYNHTQNTSVGKIYTEQYDSFDMIIDGGIANDWHYIVNYFDANNNTIGTQSATFSSFSGMDSLSYQRFSIPSGTKNIDNMGLSPVGGWSSVNKYSVSVKYSNFEKAKKWNILQDNCSPYDNIRICYLNKLGGYEYFNFNWKNTNSLSIDRKEYRKVLDWNYSVGDRQDTIYSQKVNETFTAATDFISQEDAITLKQLLISPDVYVVDGTRLLPITILDNSYNVKTLLNDKLISISITYKYAFDVNVQNN
jgi:hypothetical protein